MNYDFYTELVTYLNSENIKNNSDILNLARCISSNFKLTLGRIENVDSYTHYGKSGYAFAKKIIDKHTDSSTFKYLIIGENKYGIEFSFTDTLTKTDQHEPQTLSNFITVTYNYTDEPKFEVFGQVHDKNGGKTLFSIDALDNSLYTVYYDEASLNAYRNLTGKDVGTSVRSVLELKYFGLCPDKELNSKFLVNQDNILDLIKIISITGHQGFEKNYESKFSNNGNKVR